MEKGRFGPYESIERIGFGGFAEVWLAEVVETPREAPDLRPGRRVALKRLIKPPAMAPKEVSARFRQEAAIMRGLDHPNVVEVLDAGVADAGRGSEPYLALEHVLGRTLEKVIAAGPVDEALTLAVAQQVTAGLVAMQARGVFHRDIKPSNLILADDGGVVKIMDFGCARDPAVPFWETQVGTHLGTPLYWAPEQIRGDANKTTDLYALGFVLYELLAGRHPFYDGQRFDYLATERVIPETLRSRGVSVSPFFEALILTLLEKAPHDRIPDAARLLEILNAKERSSWWRARPRQAAQGIPPALLPARGRGGLHGRASEAETLYEAWRSAARGEGRTVLLRGLEGLGKTRLAFELADRVAREASGAAILYGAALPGGVGVAPGPLRSALRAFLGDSELMEEVDRYLGEGSRLTTAFTAFLRGEEALDRSLSLDVDGIRAAFAKVLRGIATERPVLLIVDDLQLASEEGRALFAFLAHALRDAPLLLLGTGTDDLPSAWTHALQAIDGASTLAVEPLGGDAVRRMVEERRSAETVPSVVMDLDERADGSPLYVTEYLRALGESDGVTLQLPPPRIRDLLATRLLRLNEDERELLEVAAVVGFRFDPHVVADVLERPLVPLLQDLAHLQREQGVILATPSDYVFESHAFHDMLLAELAVPLRREYHALVAQVLEQRLEAHAEDAPQAGQLHLQLVDQWLDAGRGHDALSHFEPSVDHLISGHRHLQICSLIERVLSVEGLLDPDRRLEWLVRLACEADFAADRERQWGAISQAEQMVGPSAPPALLSRLAWVHGRYLRSTGDGAGAEQESARAVREAERAGQADLLVTALALHGAVLSAGLGRLDEGQAVFQRLLDLRPAGEACEARAHAHSGLGQIANWGGDHETGLRHFQRCLDQVEEHGSLRALAVARLNLGVQLADLHRTEEAEAHLEGAVSVSREIGLRNVEAMAVRELAGVYRGAGRLDLSLEALGQGLALAHAAHDPMDAALSRVLLADLCILCGLLEAADGHLQAAYATIVASDDVESRAQVEKARGRLASAKADHLSAHDWIERASADYAEGGWASSATDCWLELARCATLSEDNATARRTLQAYLPQLNEECRGTDRLWLHTMGAMVDLVPVAQARQSWDEHEGLLGQDELPSVSHLLWRVTNDEAYLRRAHDALRVLRDHAPHEAREAIVERVLSHRRIEEDWAARPQAAR